MAQLRNQTENVTIAQNLFISKSIWSRLKGLLGRDSIPSDTAMWINPCNSIHTFGMRFSIDVVFVDRSLVVRKIVNGVHPGQLIWPVFGARSVFEFASLPTRRPVKEGDQLYVVP